MKIICSICSTEFKNDRELKVHVELVHNRVTKHQCQTCFKVNFEVLTLLIELLIFNFTSRASINLGI